MVENNNNNNNMMNRGGGGGMMTMSIAERRAAKCGFNASNMINNSAAAQPQPPTYFTIPPGISPSALLDSPVMLPNAQAQLSPTTGTFQFPNSPNHESLMKLKLKLASNGDHNSTSTTTINNPIIEFSSRPTAAQQADDHQGFPHHSAPNNLMVHDMMQFEDMEYPRDFQGMSKKDSSFEADTVAKTDQVLGNKSSREAECQPTRNQMMSSQQNDHMNGGNDRVITHPNHQLDQKHQKGAYNNFSKEVAAAKYSEDGFFWRKYGQKNVKGSEYPRSYYRCTNTNCPVRKKVERSHDGQITEIVYRYSHNHPNPQPFKPHFAEMNDSEGAALKTEGAIANINGKDDVDWRPDQTNLDGTPFLINDFSDPLSRSMGTFEPVDQNQELSSTFGSHEDGDDAQNEASPESISFNDDDDIGECEPKKRKRDSPPNESTVPRSTREPKVVVQIESEIDILDDGYRWRKYGQKVVKGNPNPRSYYKCTTPGCPVRKHVERAADDIKSVITTYEGKHNHEVPSAKTGGAAINNLQQVISSDNNLPPAIATASPLNMASSRKPDHNAPRTGKQQLVHHHHLPLYNNHQLERKPILNYNHHQLITRSVNLPGNFAGASSMYPISFPPFHSLPYSSLLMNTTNINNPITSSTASSKLYPTDYMSQISTAHHHAPAANNVPLASSGKNNVFHFNNYAAGGQDMMREPRAEILRPKEEQRVEGDEEVYGTNCQSQLPNNIQGNGTL